MKKNVISFLNMKGGVGKTTLCKEMALYFSQVKRKYVLVIDIDPQSNCTQSFFERYGKSVKEGEFYKAEDNPKSIHNIFTESAANITRLDKERVIEHLDENLDLIPADLGTVFMERSNQGDMKLYNFIATQDIKGIYDYIFIDCPPTYSFYTVNALLASDFYFVPVKPDAYSLLGLDLLERVAVDLKEGNISHYQGNTLENLGVIFTMIGGYAYKGLERNAELMRDAFSDKNIYFFNNHFKRIEKLSTGGLGTFILDRKDDSLIENLESICAEFDERVEELNGNG